MSDNLFAGMGSHQSARSNTDVWLTPLHLIHQLGRFDLDPCGAKDWPTAKTIYLERGLHQEWFGRIWLNPPYSRNAIGLWMKRMSLHNKGTALVFARTDTKWCFESVFGKAAAILFSKGRITFHTPDGKPGKGNSGAPSMFVAYGQEDRDRLAESDISGEFVLLSSLKYSVVQLPKTWLDVVTEAFRSEYRLSLRDIYDRVEPDPKTNGKKHWRDKVRQVLQLNPCFSSPRRGIWTISK